MARSVVGQQFLIQKETTAGTPLVNAMKRLLGVKAMPSIGDTGGEGFRASGHKVDTSYQIGDLVGNWEVEGIQDFNAIGYVLASALAPAVTTTPGGGTLSRQHVFTPAPAAADTLVTYTAQYGDSTQAMQAVYFVFNSLTLGIQRGRLSFGSSGLSRAPSTGATLATTGVTDVATQPIPTRSYNVWADDTWAGLGTTKLLAAYDANLTLGDKFIGDAPINSAVSGFETLLEGEDIDYSGSLTLGFDTAGVAMATTFTTEAIKFIRFGVIGPIIEGIIPYSMNIDLAVRITSVGTTTKAPNSPAIVLPFDFTLIKDPTSGNFAKVTLVNTVLTL
jgi:hypothetical protein